MYSTYYWKIFHLTWATLRWTLPLLYLPHCTPKCACQKPKNTSPCDALHVQEIVEMANSFPNKKRTGAKWKTANAPLTDWQCQGGRGREGAKCDAWRQIKRQWDSSQTGPHTSSSISLCPSFFLSFSLSLSSEINWKIIVFVFVTLEFSPCRKTFIRCLQFLPIFRLPFWKLLKGVRRQ